MTDVMPEPQAVDLDELVGDEPVGADGLDAVDEQLIARLDGRARVGGLQLASTASVATARPRRTRCCPAPPGPSRGPRCAP
jgi:putative transposase